VQVAVGPVVTAADIEQAVLQTLQAWVPFYLAEIDDQHDLDRGTTAPPRSWSVRSTDDRWLEEVPPALVVACPGTIGNPERHGDGASYSAWWQVNVGVAVGGATEAGARALAGRHAAAVSLVFGQQPAMGGLCDDAVWLGVRTDVIAEQRDVLATEVAARVRVARVLDTRGNLPRTPPDPPTDLPPDSPVPDQVRVTFP
jgi:hypothetical protein